jgi:hypothetical protein
MYIWRLFENYDSGLCISLSLEREEFSQIYNEFVIWRW